MPIMHALKSATAATLEHGQCIGLHIEINLLTAEPRKAIVGHTTEKSFMAWRVGDEIQNYQIQGLPVQIIESHEETIVLTSRNDVAPTGLRFIAYTKAMPEMTRNNQPESLRPWRMEFDVERIAQGANGYFGTITSCYLTFEPTGENLLDFF